VVLRPVFGEERFPETNFEPLEPGKEKNVDIKGVIWINNQFTVPIENHKSSHFQIKSDIAKNFYQKYYLKKDEKSKDPDFPSLIHI
jgi:hypothetical protein